MLWFSTLCSSQTKTSRPPMGREGDSRGTTHVRHHKMTRFAPTDIGLPCNAGTAAHASGGSRSYLVLRSPEQLERELRLVSVECNLITCFAPRWRLLPIYFPLSWFFNGFACYLYYLRKQDNVKAGIRPRLARQAAAGEEASVQQLNVRLEGNPFDQVQKIG